MWNWTKLGTEARHAAGAVVGIVAAVTALNVLPHPWSEVAVAVVSVGTFTGVYKAAQIPGSSRDSAK